MEVIEKKTLDLVKAALEEDIGPGDLTSLACLEPDPVTGGIFAKSDGVLSGLKPARLVFEIVDSANKFEPLISDGDSFQSGLQIVQIDGFNQTALASERTALNFLAHLSGIASLTAKFVKAVAHTKCRIIDTRKTTPGWRLLEKKAVIHGGGENHRMGLFDMILIKDNHISSAGSVTAAISGALEYLRTPDFRLQFDTTADRIEIEVEVETPAQTDEAINAGAHRLLLDNRTNEQLIELVSVARAINPDIKLEASGNMTLDRVGSVAECGVDYISVGALTHSSVAADFSMRVKAAESQ